MPKKDDLPAMPFYWGEWFKSLDVQALPRDARCVWFEMLGRMWDSSERGYFTINGKPMEASAKAGALGFGENVQTYLDYEKQLEDYGMFSRRESDGAIYSRFILKLVETRKKKQESGSKGGRKTQAGAKANAKAGALKSAKAKRETEKNIYNKEIFNDVPVPKALDIKECVKTIIDFFQYRDETLGKPLLSIIEIEAFLNDLKEKSNSNPESAIKILKYSIVGQYSNIFALKDNGNSEPEKPKRIITKCPECDTERTKKTLRRDRDQEWICEKGHEWTTKVIPPPMF